MGKRAKGKKHPNKVYSNYKVSGDNIERGAKECPKCGKGVFMAKHQNRNSCGKCSYTEFKKKE